jgi:hypothetical protein
MSDLTPRFGSQFPLFLSAFLLAYGRPGSFSRPYSAHLMPLERFLKNRFPKTTNLETARISPCHKWVTSCSLPVGGLYLILLHCPPSTFLYYFSLLKHLMVRLHLLLFLNILHLLSSLSILPVTTSHYCI